MPSPPLISTEIRRLMTVPGVGMVTAAALMAAVGEIHRFPSAKKLVGYLGLDPIVRQSGSSEAVHGRISKQGSAAGRYTLVEASWSVIKAPGPLHAFYERTKARRGAQVAIVATQAEAAYRRTVADWQRNQARRQAQKKKAEQGGTPARHRGAHLEVTQLGTAARRALAPGSAL